MRKIRKTRSLEERCLELSIFYRCVNRCLFCSNSAQMREFAGHPIPRAVLAAVLRRKRGEGFGHVTFSGGEPTLYPRVWEILRLAKELGYRIQVVSNGSAFSIDGFARETLPYVDELCLSLQSDTPKVHDKLVGRNRSFVEMRAAFDAVARAPVGLGLIVNMVVTRYNIRRLPQLARLVAAHPRARQFWISSLIPEGKALENYSALAVPNAAAMARVRAVSKVVGRRDVALRLFGFPLCALGEFRPMASELHKNPSEAIVLRKDRRGRVALGRADAGSGPKRVKTLKCRDCGLASVCGGIWERYLREFGDSEVKPWIG